MAHEDEEKKFCHRCKKFKRVGLFNFKSKYHRSRNHNHRHGKGDNYDPRKDICKHCEGLAHSAWRKKNKEYLAQYHKEYRKRKKENGRRKVQHQSPRAERRPGRQGTGAAPTQPRAI